jgi:DNA (cytosine-5)-methyltransferase 1
MQINVVDLFAGPGGLGEGFSSIEERFRIILSAEKDSSACETLRLRAFYRSLKRHRHDALAQYFGYLSGSKTQPYNHNSQSIWQSACDETRQLELGTLYGNKLLDEKLDHYLANDKPWVLIGGPPCQAYSLAGRSRNQGVVGYVPEADTRHFLYKEYLRVIAKYSPAVFVMENVKGLLSSSLGGELIFPEILRDLRSPRAALSDGMGGHSYFICSLAQDLVIKPSSEITHELGPKFTIKAEHYGIPQARHRVIILGIRQDHAKDFRRLIPSPTVSVMDVIAGLPPLRSKLSKQTDSDEAWEAVLKDHIDSFLKDPALGFEDDFSLRKQFRLIRERIRGELGSGGLRVPRGSANNVGRLPVGLESWLEDGAINVWLNHESRGHMSSDLRRYVFAASFAQAFGRSPKGHEDFKLEGLAPNHKNWRTGNFSDRFRVQVGSAPATTITSHISKDGHYFIHPDPAQCRSLTVREAARIQTFPDNYFFEGNRTQQYHQVGNAVPPYLANQIANIVSDILS